MELPVEDQDCVLYIVVEVVSTHSLVILLQGIYCFDDNLKRW